MMRELLLAFLIALLAGCADTQTHDDVRVLVSNSSFYINLQASCPQRNNNKNEEQ